jgi:NAD(P)-dependent dehydrogenase (short-subunit alcohol dehydrogenase family)
MGTERELDANGVAGDDGPSALHNAHDPGPANKFAVRIAGNGDLQQARTKVIDLLAGVAQACDTYDRLLPQAQAGIARMSSLEEVAKAVVFLASDDASNIHGATLSVDGGFSAALGRRGPVRQERVDQTLRGQAGGEGAVPDVGL